MTLIQKVQEMHANENVEINFSMEGEDTVIVEGPEMNGVILYWEENGVIESHWVHN